MEHRVNVRLTKVIGFKSAMKSLKWKSVRNNMTNVIGFKSVMKWPK